MSIWEAMEKLSELVDDSDPDVGVSRLFHCALLLARFIALVLAPRPFLPTSTNLFFDDCCG